MNYIGTIVEESLSDTSILQEVLILNTKTSIVTEKNKTPWLRKWTLSKTEIPENSIDQISYKLSQNLNTKYWYADFKNNEFHYIIYRDKIFKVDLSNPIMYIEAKKFGLALGIPGYQLDFK